MKKSLVIVLSLVLTVSVFSATKKTSLEEDGLKGKVKERVGTYSAVKTKIDNEVKIGGKDITKYDNRGNRIEGAIYDGKGKLLNISTSSYTYY